MQATGQVVPQLLGTAFSSVEKESPSQIDISTLLSCVWTRSASADKYVVRSP